VTTLTEAYDTAEQITRTEARNFYYGIRLLPGPKRRALCAIYALARRVDDIGDDDRPVAEKLPALEQVSASLGQLRSGKQDFDDPVMIALADASRTYPIPLGALNELVEGVRMDIVGTTFETFDDLVIYCRCVAGSVGRLCLSIFGGPQASADDEAIRLADTLGIALQQTNILRDIREDLLNGRVYLPQEDLAKFGVDLRVENGRLADPEGNLAELIRYRAAEAQRWYAEGLKLVPMLDRRSAACCSAMAGIYVRLLAEIEADPRAVYHQRLSLSGGQKLRVALRSLTGARA
jgi:phytoene synthase